MATTAATAAGYLPVWNGVLHSQGEHDANQINLSQETQGQYIAALTTMIGRYRSAAVGGVTYPSLPFYLFKTGTDTSKPDAGFAQVRAAQEQVIGADPLSRIVWRDAYDYVALGYMQGSPPDHYTQAGYNLMGQNGASKVVSAQVAARRKCMIDFPAESGRRRSGRAMP